jgi:hypothetical protein
MKTLVRSFAFCALSLLAACNAESPSPSSGEAHGTSLEQAQLIAECRGTTRDCLKGAITVTDISSCRDVFTACVGDAVDLVDEGLSSAIDLAEEAIDITIDQATGLIEDVDGLGSNAINAVNECRAGVTHCLAGVVSVSDISKCQEIFDGCVGSAVSVVNDLAVDNIGIHIDLPGVSKPGGCSLGVSTCLGKGTPPAQCAIDAQICLAH